MTERTLAPQPGSRGAVDTSESTRTELGARLASALGEVVRFDSAARAAYATDSSNYRHIPLGIVYPRDEGEVTQALAICAELEAPVFGRGAGTSLAGQACNVAVVLDMSRHMDAILAIDPERRVARVQPGVVLDHLQAALAPHRLVFGPDPATHAYCTIGGMVGNNSCGTHGLRAGKTVDNVEQLIVQTYGGARLVAEACAEASYAAIVAAGGEPARIYTSLRELAERYAPLIRARYLDIPRRVSGYNLDELLPERGFNIARALVGTESTCALTTEITLRLIDEVRERRLVVLGFPSVFEAADYVPALLGRGLYGLEGFDEVLVRQMRAARLNVSNLELLPPGGGWLLAEVGGEDPGAADAAVRELLGDLAPGIAAVTYSSAAEQRAVWAIRESGLGATAHPPNEVPNHEGWEDAAVAPEALGEYLRGIDRLWGEFGYSGAWYGHFGQGCVHTRNNFDFSTTAGVARFRAYVERAAELCVSLGGSLSGEHGDGQARGELLEKMYGSELVGAFEAFKAIFDPIAKMNPGKIVHALPLDENLSLGPDRRRSRLGPLYFSFPDDAGSLQLATERCVGVGRCRRDDIGVMCPSFRATRDELHSTRGRAKLLGEMFQGEVTPETWRNTDVFEALELCLSCKGCVTDCPTHVDMATYKSEFLAHHYRRRLHPVVDYALGLVPWLARLATTMPGCANLVLGEHRLGRLLRRWSGLSTTRPVPRFAKKSFRRSSRARASIAVGDATVVVWPDTFSDAYAPARASAAVTVLEAAGERVAVPASWACCGRPLFDVGMLDLARRTLTHVLDVVEPYLVTKTPIVVLEPSCLSVFRDEAPKLLANDPRAAALAGLARSLSEHLVSTAWLPPRRVAGTPAYIHPHCHQRAVIGNEADRALLASLGYRVEVLDAGCCGLAGGFGFRATTAALATTIAEQRFLPAIAGVAPGACLVMDGFSCALQARELAGITPTTTAELVLEALADR